MQALRRASGGVAGVGTYPTGDTRGTLRASGRTHQKRREEHPSFLPVSERRRFNLWFPQVSTLHELSLF